MEDSVCQAVFYCLLRLVMLPAVPQRKEQMWTCQMTFLTLSNETVVSDFQNIERKTEYSCHVKERVKHSWSFGNLDWINPHTFREVNQANGPRFIHPFMLKDSELSPYQTTSSRPSHLEFSNQKYQPLNMKKLQRDESILTCKQTFQKKNMQNNSQIMTTSWSSLFSKSN